MSLKKEYGSDNVTLCRHERGLALIINTRNVEIGVTQTATIGMSQTTTIGVTHTVLSQQ